MTTEEKVKQIYPDARCAGFGYLSGLVHIVTNESTNARYKSAPFEMENPSLAWNDAWLRIRSDNPVYPREVKP